MEGTDRDELYWCNADTAENRKDAAHEASRAGDGNQYTFRGQLAAAKREEISRSCAPSTTIRPKFTTPCSGAWVRGETDGRIIETHLAEDDVPYVNLGGLLLDRVDPILRCYSLDGGARCHTEARTTLKRLGPCQATNGHRKCGAAACRMTPPLRDLNIVGNVGR